MSESSHKSIAKAVLSGIAVTVLGGLILAYVLQDARFDPGRTPPIEPTDQPSPPSIPLSVDIGAWTNIDSLHDGPLTPRSYNVLDNRDAADAYSTPGDWYLRFERSGRVTGSTTLITSGCGEEGGPIAGLPSGAIIDAMLFASQRGAEEILQMRTDAIGGGNSVPGIGDRAISVLKITSDRKEYLDCERPWPEEIRVGKIVFVRANSFVEIYTRADASVMTSEQHLRVLKNTAQEIDLNIVASME